MKTFSQFILEQTAGNIIAVYPGRFQPMFTHHKLVYDNLIARFGNNRVFIATSDDTSNRLTSPLNFEQKKLVMTKMLGIKPSKILQRVSPYRVDLYGDIKREDQILFFALGEKDQQERFPFKNMKEGVCYKKDNITPAAIQPESALYNPIIENKAQHAFITIIPNVESASGVMKATDFRTAIRESATIEDARQIFFKAYNKPVNNSMDDVIQAIRRI